jgi:hypothetical protein
MSAIWADSGGLAAASTVAGKLWRMVESQEQIATMALVDTLAEQAELERLIERSKPPRQGTEHLHYLLATPFRYPPLRHGSRFGSCFEPSLYYGALQTSALLAETAYYRFVFAAGPARPFPAPLLTHHTAFSARFRAGRGVRLQAPPFDRHRERLTSRISYADTQALGTAMRADGVQAFTFVSARDPEEALNAALFEPSALVDTSPREQASWSCETTATMVTLREHAAHRVTAFALATFLVDGRLPAPAT